MSIFINTSPGVVVGGSVGGAVGLDAVVVGGSGGGAVVLDAGAGSLVAPAMQRLPH